MRPRLVVLLALIVITPLAIVGWLGVRVVRDEQVVVQHRFRELSLGQLRSVDLALAGAVERYQAAVLDEMPRQESDLDELRRRTRESPYVVQYYVIDPEGRFLFPPVRTPSELTLEERESLQRTRQIWDSGVVASGASEGEGAVQGSTEASGWNTWYWGNGLQWMLWSRDGQRIFAAEINRARFLAELIGELPETDVLAPELAEGRIRLLDSAGAPLYQWGAHEADDSTVAVASLTAGPPLGGWTLEYHAPGSVFGAAVAGGFLLNLTVGLTLTAGLVVGLTYFFYRAQSREIREAAQRVSFVNQVSHELKTPLTSIRMYAELLEANLHQADDTSRRHLGVIVSESQRLSRLIGNVLTFGRTQRGTLKLHHKPGVVDEILQDVLDHFKPVLEARGIEVAFAPGAGERVSIDSDALEQILGNLISNVEKYGAAGGRLELTSGVSAETVDIVVADHGPGLPKRERRRIFEPFYRVSSALTEGVSGTGIGLTISRELARLHGGDLVLEPSERGSRFRLTLHCPPAAED